MIAVAVDDASPVPPYEQVRAQIASAIGVGAVTAGTRLPTVRQLARDLGLAPNTVARAYRALEEAHLIETNGRRGTTVAPRPLASPGRRHALAAAASEYLNRARQLGASNDEAVSTLRSVIS